MRRRILMLALLALVTVATSAQWASQPDSGEPKGVPAYNPAPQKGQSLPPILPKERLWGASFQYPYQVHAYELAAKIPRVIHQQPCYCYCDRMGHNSLHSCFESTHGANCAACLKEVYYSYQQHKAGKTAKQIRENIIRGEWKQIDLQSAASIN
jgi:hypothetical protein